MKLEVGMYARIKEYPGTNILKLFEWIIDYLEEEKLRENGFYD